MYPELVDKIHMTMNNEYGGSQDQCYWKIEHLKNTINI